MAPSSSRYIYLGLPGIQPGLPADFVLYASDPRADLSALDHPELIVLDGRVIPPIQQS
jgi:hypothetical protein